MSKKEKKITPLKAPNPILILVAIVLFCAVATYIVPAGVFDRIADPSTGRMIVDPNSFHYVEQNPVKLFDIFKSLTLGLQKSSDVIFFLFIIGGAFGIMDATGAIRSGMGNMVKKMAGKELFLIPVCMLIFGMGSCFAANYEEFLVFVPLIIPICIAMGFDSLTALGIVFGAAGAGYAGGCTNAFTVGVAQSISGLPMFAGIGLRCAAFVALLGVSIVYVMFRAVRVKKDPMSSAMYEIDRKREDAIDLSSVPALTKRHILVLIIFVGGIIGMVVGVLEFGFYIDELAALFLVVGILAGVCGGLTPNQIVDEFLKGCNNLLFANVMIGLCSATTIIMTDANIMDTIIHALAQTLVGLPPHAYCVRYVRGTGSNQSAGALRLRAGRHYHAHYGAFGGPDRCDKADSRSGVPVWRFLYQRDHPHRQHHHGGAGHGQGPLLQVVSVSDPAVLPVVACGLCLPDLRNDLRLRPLLTRRKF